MRRMMATMTLFMMATRLKSLYDRDNFSTVLYRRLADSQIHENIMHV